MGEDDFTKKIRKYFDNGAFVVSVVTYSKDVNPYP